MPVVIVGGKVGRQEVRYVRWEEERVKSKNRFRTIYQFLIDDLSVSAQRDLHWLEVENGDNDCYAAWAEGTRQEKLLYV